MSIAHGHGYNITWALGRSSTDAWQMASVVQLAFDALYLSWGGGRHEIHLASEQVAQVTKNSNLSFAPFIICTNLTRISITILVLRFTSNKWIRH